MTDQHRQPKGRSYIHDKTDRGKSHNIWDSDIFSTSRCGTGEALWDHGGPQECQQPAYFWLMELFEYLRVKIKCHLFLL